MIIKLAVFDSVKVDGDEFTKKKGLDFVKQNIRLGVTRKKNLSPVEKAEKSKRDNMTMMMI